MSSAGWRASFAIAGLTIAAGGMTHPRGATMESMLADQNWVVSHVLQLVGYSALVAGLLLIQRTGGLTGAVATALRFAVVGGVLQTVEMAFHTAAVVDLQHLRHGESTPVLTTHLWLSMAFYPIFGAAMVWFIAAGARDRSFGGWGTAWLGIAGAAAHGAAPLLVVGLQLESARILFPCVMLFAVWLMLRASNPGSARSNAASGAAAVPG